MTKGVTFNLWSANAFNFDKAKILSSGKGLKLSNLKILLLFLHCISVIIILTVLRNYRKLFKEVKGK